MNLLQQFENKQLETLKAAAAAIPDFSPGDTVRVNVRVREGDGDSTSSRKELKERKERIQAFEGVCIGRSGTDLNASFTVRKISLNEGVERVFPLYSPRIESIKLIRRGDVRRAKLYYLRDRRGKRARIAERTSGHGLGDSADEASQG